MIDFEVLEDVLLLVYEPDTAEPNWVSQRFANNEEIALKMQTYSFQKEDLFEVNDEGFGTEYKLVLGERTQEDYYKIEGRKLGIDIDVYFHKEIDVSAKLFSAPHNISIFKNIAKVVKADLYVGGGNENAVPKKDFQKLIKNYPNSYELSKYAEARLGTVLSDYFSSASVANEQFQAYMNRKPSVTGTNLAQGFRDIEIEKYRVVLDNLKQMLSEADQYSEKQWQLEILDIILLLFPKYVYVFENAIVRDQYQKKNRKLDLLLVDAEGHVDVIEIKKPFENSLMSTSQYRDNYVPKRELSGSIVQIEKYIFHLSKSGVPGEEKLKNQFASKLPADFKLEIVNPSGLIIVGRDETLSSQQKADFEIVKRKYKNILDIITYDNLIRRLERVIESWRVR